MSRRWLVLFSILFLVLILPNLQTSIWNVGNLEIHEEYANAVPLTNQLAPTFAKAGPEEELTLVPSGSTFSDLWTVSNSSLPVISGSTIISGDLYGLQSGSKGVIMSESDSSLSVSVNLKKAKAKSDDAIVAYPNIGYGFSVFGGGTSRYDTPLLELPLQLNVLPEIVSEVNYSTTHALRTDYAYDIWITQDMPTSNTRTAVTGDIELMIWTQYNDLFPQRDAGPPSQPVASVDLPTLVNGANEPLLWNIYVYNGAQSADKGWTKVFIVLSDPINSGTVGIDLGQMISEMTAALLVYYPSHWQSSNLSQYWLDQISLGSEFAIKSPNYSWNASSYCFLLNYPPLSEGLSGSSYPCA